MLLAPAVVTLCVRLGLAVESAIIDIDHWRYYFVILGGLMAASLPYLCARGRPLAGATV